jgi:DNA polymerase III alpha subunit (gram-positive type)
MKLLVIDVETTGLLPKSHSVIELAAQLIKLTPEGVKKIGEPLEFRHHPHPKRKIEPKALEINGYYPDHPDWKTAPVSGSRAAANDWRKFSHMAADALITAQNVQFDLHFCEDMLILHDIKPNFQRRTIDVMALSALVAGVNGIKSMSLDAVYPLLQGPEKVAHRALSDVERAIYIIDCFHKALRSWLKLSQPSENT